MGFSADWLALREPADLRARDSSLLASAIRAAGQAPEILDLGSGTGSTMRAFGQQLDSPACWRLVDSDPELLGRATPADGRNISRHQIDLRHLDDLPLEGVHLVTASALLDLCSYDWVRALARRLAARSLPFYAALNYDGVMRWSIPVSGDLEIVNVFNRHQCSDKGFGPALGPESTRATSEIFTAVGYTVTSAESPWVLGAGDEPLHDALVDGIAQAAMEAGATDALGWGTRRKADRRCLIGHGDVLALPPASVAGTGR